MVHLQCSVEATHRAMVSDFPRNGTSVASHSQLPSLPPAYAEMLMSLCWGLEVCKAPAHRWCREIQCCELWSCCCWAGSSGCASTVWLVRLGVGGLMVGQDRGSFSSFVSSHSRKSRVGLDQLQSPTCACGVDADGTVKYCLCWCLVRLPAAAAL